MNHEAIYNTHSNVVSIDDNSGAFDADGNSVTLDQSLVDIEITRLQAEYDNAQYARDRVKAYPSLTEQADMAYWDRQNNTTTLDDAITAIKLQFPKG
jgi:hypothetical protein